jgi:hypothetical protein
VDALTLVRVCVFVCAWVDLGVCMDKLYTILTKGVQDIPHSFICMLFAVRSSTLFFSALVTQ